MQKVATIKDIAKELGISTSTVSRILNGKNQRNEELVNRVKETAIRLNYQVNTSARGLRTRKSGLLGIIVPQINDEFFAEVLSGIEQVADARGYNLMICQSNESREKEEQLVKSLILCNVEGVLISLTKHTNDLSFLRSIHSASKKVLLFDRVIRQEEFYYIQQNDSRGTYTAGRYLIQRNSRKFLYLGLSRDLNNDHERLSGYNRVMEEFGLEMCKVAYVEEFDRVHRILTDAWDPSYDTVVCYNDHIAAEVLAFFNEKNIAVPDQVAVCGFDNRSLCKYTSPMLTSVEQPTRLIGQLAANTLLGHLNNSDFQRYRLENNLIVRGSTR